MCAWLMEQSDRGGYLYERGQTVFEAFIPHGQLCTFMDHFGLTFA